MAPSTYTNRNLHRSTRAGQTIDKWETFEQFQLRHMKRIRTFASLRETSYRTHGYLAVPLHVPVGNRRLLILAFYHATKKAL